MAVSTGFETIASSEHDIKFVCPSEKVFVRGCGCVCGGGGGGG